MAALYPAATGIYTYTSPGVVVDYSNAKEGYIGVLYSKNKEKNCKVMVKKDGGGSMNFDVTYGKQVFLPLSLGAGAYTVQVFEQVEGTKYKQILLCGFDAKIEDPQRPYLYPNTYCDYNGDSECVRFLDDICGGMATQVEKLAVWYAWVVDNIHYDYDLAATVTADSPWWLPDPDAVLRERKSICFGFASLFAALRSQGIPVRIEVGRVGYMDVKHAYNAVWLDDGGHITEHVDVLPKTWFRLDPTFDATGASDKEIAALTADDLNYKFEYRG